MSAFNRKQRDKNSKMKCNENNFDFLRLFAASMVLFSHQHALMGRPGIDTGLGERFGLGGLGVCIFFIVSGYLVTQSWLRDPNAFRFLAKRFLRIWPGLFIVTCIAALLVGPIVSGLDVKNYFSSPGLREYFGNLRVIGGGTSYLPDVFTHNPFPRAVNGSLWTIPVEVHWYLVLVVAAVAGALRWRWIALFGIVGLAIYHFGVYHGETNPVRNWSREYGLFFLAGALLQLFRDWWADRQVLLIVGSLTVGTALFMLGWHVLGVLVAMPCLVIFTGEASTPFLRRFGRFGDLSYGVYIYAFIVQQTLIWKFGASGSFTLHLLSTVVVTFICAWLSWHLVEKRALSFKPSRIRSGKERIHEVDLEKNLA
ncbi:MULTISPECIES: acyltransferase family protein [Burkholderia]|nr:MULTISPECIES: acyltransferase [Burkholderia]